MCKNQKVSKSGQYVCIFSLFVLPKSLYIDRIGINDNTGLQGMELWQENDTAPDKQLYISFSFYVQS